MIVTERPECFVRRRILAVFEIILGLLVLCLRDLAAAVFVTFVAERGINLDGVDERIILHRLSRHLVLCLLQKLIAVLVSVQCGKLLDRRRVFAVLEHLRRMAVMCLRDHLRAVAVSAQLGEHGCRSLIVPGLHRLLGHVIAGGVQAFRIVLCFLKRRKLHGRRIIIAVFKGPVGQKKLGLFALRPAVLIVLQFREGHDRLLVIAVVQQTGCALIGAAPLDGRHDKQKQNHYCLRDRKHDKRQFFLTLIFHPFHPLSCVCHRIYLPARSPSKSVQSPHCYSRCLSIIQHFHQIEQCIFWKNHKFLMIFTKNRLCGPSLYEV